MKDSEKTSIILKALKEKHQTWGNDRKFVIFPELRLGSGYEDVAQRRIDLFVISSLRGNLTYTYEIKVSKQDFKKDIMNEAKQRGARLYSSHFYYVTPKGLLDLKDIPVWAGLMEYDFTTKTFATKLPAPLSARNNPSWGLICGIIRKVNKLIGWKTVEEQNIEISKLKRQIESKDSIIQRQKWTIANLEKQYGITRTR